MKKTNAPQTRITPRRRPLGPEPDLLAAQALAFLAEDPDRLGRFLALTGLDAAALRAASRQPNFTSAVLGHLAEDEGLLVAFATHAGLEPEVVGAVARAVTAPETPDM